MIGRRYQLLEELGSGGMGTVFRALDRLNGIEVALKCVTTPALELGGARRDLSLTQTLCLTPGYQAVTQNRLTLAREFRLLASLRHPNVISVLDYGFDAERRPFYTMEVIDQPQTLVEAGRGLPLERRVELLMQMLQALAYLHRRGVIHRDLKPSNVLVESGRVKVLDFGLSELRDHTVGETAISGTIAYLAPEVLAGEPASEASDLYAAGVIAFELFTGEHPLGGGHFNQILLRVLHEPAHCSHPDLDPRLRGLFERVLAKRPEQRPASVNTLMHEVAAALDLRLPAETAEIRESFLQAASFVGREAELAQLSELLRQALAGRGGALLVAGESGVGKSRLIDELRALSLVEGALVLGGQAVHEGSSPYHVWRQPLRWLCLASEIDDATASVLKPLIGDLEELLGHAVGDAPGLDPQAAQRRLLLAVETLLRGQRLPIVLILEDLQWAGSESLAMVERLASLAPELPLLLLGTCRDDENPQLAEQLGKVPVLKLRRLGETAIAELCASMLGPLGCEPQILELLHRETEGNVFFLVEVVRALAEEAGRLESIDVASLPRQVLTGGIRRILRRRLERVSDDGHELLRAAAVAGREIDLAVLSALGTGQDLAAWLRRLAEAAVLEVHGKQWRFAHDKLRETLLLDLDAASRRQLHHRVAEAIETIYGTADEHWAELAHHWSKAADGEEPTAIAKAVFYLTAAGKQALQSSAVGESMALLERALELLRRAPGSDDDRRQEVDLLIELGAAQLMLKGHADPAVGATLEQARQLCLALGETPQLLPVLLGRWRYEIVRGDLAASRQLAEQLSTQAEAEQDPAFAVLASYALGTNLLFQGEPEPAWKRLSHSIERFAAFGHHFQHQLAKPFFYGQHPAVAAHAYGGWALWCLGYPDRACRHTDAALAFAKKLGHPFSEAFAYILSAWVFQLRREEEKCLSYSARAIAIANEHGFAYFRAVGDILHGWAEAASSRREGVAQRMRRTIDGVKAGGSTLFQPYFLALNAEALACEGQPEAGLDTVAEALEAAMASGEGWWEAEVLRLQGDLWHRLRPNDRDLADFCYRRALERARKRRERSLELRAAASLARLWHGDPEHGPEMLDQVQEIYDRFTEGFAAADLAATYELLDHTGE